MEDQGWAPVINRATAKQNKKEEKQEQILNEQRFTRVFVNESRPVNQTQVVPSRQPTNSHQPTYGYANNKPSAKNSDKKSTGGNAIQGVKVSKTVATNFDPNSIQKIVTSNQDLAKAIQIARTKTKSRTDPLRSMNQSELDNACALPKNTVRDYENGTAQYIPEQVNAMSRVLATALPRPSKK